MIYSFTTNKNSVIIDLVISTDSKRKIIIAGFDTIRKNTKYFFREMFVDGRQDYSFKMPKSPDKLHIVIYDYEENNPYSNKSDFFKVESLKSSALPLKQLNFDEKILTWVDFVQEFCVACGDIETGSYSDDKGLYEIRFMDKIMNNDGEVILTPARIHKQENYIEVSKEYFDKLTVPSRIMILNHEFAHNFLNREMNNEVEADINGLKLYLSMDYPVIESIYAFTQIFRDSDINIHRLDTIIAYIGHYQTEKESKEQYKEIYETYKNKFK